MAVKLAVPVSGSGTILEAMIGSGLSISLVFADRPCRGIEIAEKANIPCILMLRSFGKDFDRFRYTSDVIALLERFEIGLVAMAGYMTVFHPIIFKVYAQRILNIHPALLPLFKGDRAVADALAAGVEETGTTIHYATEELDEGPVVAQERVPVLPGDTVKTLHERIKIVERRLYPQVVRRLLGLAP